MPTRSLALALPAAPASTPARARVMIAAVDASPSRAPVCSSLSSGPMRVCSGMICERHDAARFRTTAVESLSA